MLFSQISGRSDPFPEGGGTGCPWRASAAVTDAAASNRLHFLSAGKVLLQNNEVPPPPTSNPGQSERLVHC